MSLALAPYYWRYKNEIWSRWLLSLLFVFDREHRTLVSRKVLRLCAFGDNFLWVLAWAHLLDIKHPSLEIVMCQFSSSDRITEHQASNSTHSMKSWDNNTDMHIYDLTIKSNQRPPSKIQKPAILTAYRRTHYLLDMSNPVAWLKCINVYSQPVLWQHIVIV